MSTESDHHAKYAPYKKGRETDSGGQDANGVYSLCYKLFDQVDIGGVVGFLIVD